MSVITYTCGSWISNQGTFKSGRPWGRVIHSLECDSVAHIARSLSEPGGYLDNENLAPQRMVDPADAVSVLTTNMVGGHVGTANPHVVGYEHAGRAAWSRGQWLDGGRTQATLELSARLMAEDYHRDGWTREEIRWLSGAQIKANYNGSSRTRGLLTHNDVSQFIGGTNHWDPGTGFPFDWYLDRVRAYYDNDTTAPSVGGGGGTPTEEDDLPYNPEELVQHVNYGVDRALNRPEVLDRIAAAVANRQASSKVNGVGTTFLEATLWADANGYWANEKLGTKLDLILQHLGLTVPATPPSSGGTYTVGAGDTLTSIAAKLGVTVDALAAANGIVNRDAIDLGQVLVVPGK